MSQPRKPVQPGPPRLAAREVRIIGGRWKRSKLPVADKPGLRPTPDRVRETLFNWLGQDLDGWRVLDAFAGSGALGFEAASRGAAEVLLLERDADLVRSLNNSRAKLGAEQLRVEASDALAWMARAPAQRFELVFLDPPFAAGLFEPALRAAAPLLVEGGYLYLESPEAIAVPPECGLTLWREARAGAVHYCVLRRSG
ncbi:16S rRNA (guanine(966)-N(2))-methyltransferase RsmD [Paucibacter sp. APW11]|uniref:16S rRNA (Guanine(966)-N(2))-methyltransferase RsmD n=2 Tax=Roseateles aquae TaxID=3077235 RepID=A0ABU3PC75_9BURK|nr:16S rRNA (guanine(966)-N(2))-methyltransferase RsmD [Paucibacter sp. APW11]MDT9000179.1 16S rRNA (guanine(966)-N(2))-methyltransferase RsmD [Paucibacter sp. APW11]